MKVLHEVVVFFVREPGRVDEQLELLSMWLRSEGAKLCSCDFADALGELAGARASAIVIDLRSEPARGYELLAAVRAQPARAQLPAIGLVERDSSSAAGELPGGARFQKLLALPAHPSDLVGALVGLVPNGAPDGGEAVSEEPAAHASEETSQAQPGRVSVPPAGPSRAAVLAGLLKARAARNDMRGMLQLLNATGPFRYTSILRFDGAQLSGVWTFDREQPDSDSFPVDKKIPDSYCALVLASGAPVSIPDVSTQPSLSQHPARHTVLSYCGVPLRRADESFFGTLCHFDVVPRLFVESTVKRLEETALLLREHLPAVVTDGRPSTD
jgi:CheY-like chemotaxis protein